MFLLLRRHQHREHLHHLNYDAHWDEELRIAHEGGRGVENGSSVLV
jgi:hypothetical protein